MNKVTIAKFLNANAAKIIILLALSINAIALPKYEIGAYSGYRFAGSFELEDGGSYKLDDSDAFSLTLSMQEKQNTHYEILYTEQKTQAELSDAISDLPNILDLHLRSLHFGGTYMSEESLRDAKLFVPYMAFTLGATQVEAQSERTSDDIFFSGSLGFGLKTDPRKKLGLRAELRGHGMALSTDANFFCESGSAGANCSAKFKGSIFLQAEAVLGLVLRF